MIDSLTEICSLPFSFLLSKKQKSGAMNKKAETRRACSELQNITSIFFFRDQTVLSQGVNSINFFDGQIVFLYEKVF